VGSRHCQLSMAHLLLREVRMMCQQMQQERQNKVRALMEKCGSFR
jgi:hypothetical protein